MHKMRIRPKSFVFLKSVIGGKNKWSVPYFQNVVIVLNLAYNKNKLYETLEYWSRHMVNFDILDKGAEKVSPSHFMYDS